jgi:hypothetical protein
MISLPKVPSVNVPAIKPTYPVKARCLSSLPPSTKELNRSNAAPESGLGHLPPPTPQLIYRASIFFFPTVSSLTAFSCINPRGSSSSRIYIYISRIPSCHFERRGLWTVSSDDGRLVCWCRQPFALDEPIASSHQPASRARSITPALAHRPLCDPRRRFGPTEERIYRSDRLVSFPLSIYCPFSPPCRFVFRG